MCKAQSATAMALWWPYPVSSNIPLKLLMYTDEGSESNFMSVLLDDDMTGLHFMTSEIGWFNLRCWSCWCTYVFRLGSNLLSPSVFRHQTNVGFSSLTVLLISSHFVKKVDSWTDKYMMRPRWERSGFERTTLGFSDISELAGHGHHSAIALCVLNSVKYLFITWLLHGP